MTNLLIHFVVLRLGDIAAIFITSARYSLHTCSSIPAEGIDMKARDSIFAKKPFLTTRLLGCSADLEALCHAIIALKCVKGVKRAPRWTCKPRVQTNTSLLHGGTMTAWVIDTRL